MKDKIWAEKYRPQKLEEYIFPKDGHLERCFEKWAEQKVFPNMVLAGVQGTGKSTLAGILINEFGVDSNDVLTIDGSSKNKVGDMREIVIPFCEYSPLSTFKVVLIEESHRLTADAQAALLDTIERRSEDVRFIFTTNFPKKLSAALLSRCPPFHFSEGFDEDRALERICYILEEEGYGDIIDNQGDMIESHTQAFKPDIRAIISSIQDSIYDGKLGTPKNSIRSSSIEEWEQAWKDDSLDVDRLMGMVYLVDNTNFESFYTAIYENGLHHFNHEEKAEVVVYISDFLSKAMGATTQGIQSIHLEALLHTIFNYVGEN